MSVVKSMTLTAVAVGALLSASAALASKPETFANGRSWHGVPSSAEIASQVVDVKSAQAINVKCGDTVTFRSGEKSFSWRFDVLNHRAVDVRKIAPAGFMTDKLMVYVSPSEYERK